MVKTKSKVKTAIGVLIYFALWAGLAVLFLNQDLAISVNLHNPDSLFGKIFQAIGEIPNTITLVLSSATLFSLRQPNENIKVNSLYTIGYGGLCFAASTFGLLYAWKQVFGVSPSMIITALVGLLIALFVLYFFSKIPSYKLDKFKKIALVGMFTGVFALFFTAGGKLLFGRTRPRDMKDPVKDFMPLNKITLFGSEGNSFPSGHTASASTTNVLRLFINENNSVIKNALLWIASYAWPLVVAFSRIVSGAHFASDTLFSFFICLGAFTVIRMVIMNTKISEYL